MSKKIIRPQGAEGISHPCNLAKASFTVNDSSTCALPFSVDGFHAAELWHVAFCAAADAAEGYLFPSGLRQAFEALPMSARTDFLDGVGALFVNFQVIGEPVPGRQDVRADVALHAMAPHEQDAWAEEQQRSLDLADEGEGA